MGGFFVESGDQESPSFTSYYFLVSVEHSREMFGGVELRSVFVELEPLDLLGQIEVIHALADLECEQENGVPRKDLMSPMLLVDDFLDKTLEASLSEDI